MAASISYAFWTEKLGPAIIDELKLEDPTVDSCVRIKSKRVCLQERTSKHTHLDLLMTQLPAAESPRLIRTIMNCDLNAHLHVPFFGKFLSNVFSVTLVTLKPQFQIACLN